MSKVIVFLGNLMYIKNTLCSAVKEKVRFMWFWTDFSPLLCEFCVGCGKLLTYRSDIHRISSVPDITWQQKCTHGYSKKPRFRKVALKFGTKIKRLSRYQCFWVSLMLLVCSLWFWNAESHRFIFKSWTLKSWHFLRRKKGGDGIDITH